MSELLRQFHFLHPAWLWLLAALPLLGWVATRGQTGRHALSRLVDAALLPHLMHGRQRRRWFPAALLVAGWVLCALALAGPSWSRVAQPLFANRAAQVVAISLSQRTLARDVAPSRLDRARFKARDLLAANRDGLNGLLAYAGEAFVVAPLTSDAGSLNDLLDALAPDTMPVDGDNAAAAIERGAALISDAKAGGGSLVLIADTADADAQAAARRALAANVRVSVLGVGTTAGAPVPLAEGGFLHDGQGNLVLARRDDRALAALAAAGGGRYVPLRDDGADIAALHDMLQNGPGSAASGQLSEQWQDRGPWLLLALLPIVALVFRRGWLLLLPLMLLPLWPRPAAASTWSDLWQRPDQQAAQALRQGQPKQAMHLAKDPALRGAAAYRAGDYAAAAQALRGAHGADARYNLGNALAKAAHYKEALTAYDRALKLDPAHADAKANRQAVEDWLRQQQKQDVSDKSKPGSSGQKSGQDKQGANNKGADNKGGQGKSGEQGKQDGQGGQQGKPGGDGKPDESQRPSSGKPAESSSAASAPQPPPLTPQQQAEQKARTEQARQALQQQMDQALQSGQGKPQQKRGSKNAPHQLGTLDENDGQARMPAELRQALQRVPDDPGALLRRKFELEYRERHGASPQEDGQP